MKDIRVVYSLNHSIEVSDERSASQLSTEARRTLAWNMDLVLGPPDRTRKARKAPNDLLLDPKAAVHAPPSDIWLALDAKGVMTEHGKARRNRQRDVTALWAVIHTFFPRAIVAAAIPINIAPQFKSPLRKEVTVHKNVERIVDETLSIFRAVKRADLVEGGAGIEALGCFVVDYANTPESEAALRETAPAPKEGDRIHYDTMIKNLGDALVARYSDHI